MERHKIDYGHIKKVAAKVHDEINRQMDIKGDGEFISYHETLGVITEEYYELIGAVQSNIPHNIKEELMDIAVACLFGIASIDNQIDRIGMNRIREKEDA